MGGGGRRSLRRGCFAAAAACCVLFVALPARAQDSGTDPPVSAKPAIWRGAASSRVASVDVDRDALLPIPGIFRFIALQGDSVYETDNQTARASLFFPGEGVMQGPNLACGTFGSAFPAEFKPILDACTKFDYPLTVTADASAPDKSTLGSVQLGKVTDAISADAVLAKAHAASDASTTQAVISNLRVLGLPGIDAIPLIPIQQLQLDPSVAVIGHASSTTDQRITDGKLVVQADSTLSGVKLVGGLINIGSIHSTSKITDDANGKRTADASLQVSGVTVGGIPAQITHDGIILGTSTTPLGPILQQVQVALEQLLSTLGVKIALLDTTKTTDDGTGQARASAGGLLLELALNVQGAPTVPGPLGDIDLSGTYVGNVQLGSTGVTGAASNFDDSTTLPPEDTTIPPGLGGDGGFVDTGTTGFDIGPPTTSPPGPVVTPPPGRHLVRTLTDPFDDRLGLLYLAFALTVLGLCILPRLTLPARLPGSSS
jgi:hypothetical protein